MQRRWRAWWRCGTPGLRGHRRALGSRPHLAPLRMIMESIPGSAEAGKAEANIRVPDVRGFDKLIKHPLGLVSFVPKELALFFAGAGVDAAAKTVTAPMDRVKLLMQVHGV